ncbi:MAG: SHOCT domain-containing protein [Acutalibacteraceae bacterium]
MFRDINPKKISKEKNNKQANQNNTVEQLKYYKELLDENIITQEEFEQKKKEVLE